MIKKVSSCLKNTFLAQFKGLNGRRPQQSGKLSARLANLLILGV
jgi:hypothetical protein